MDLRYLKKYYRKSNGFDGGKTYQSYILILQYFDENDQQWIDVPTVDDKKSKKKTEFADEES